MATSLTICLRAADAAGPSPVSAARRRASSSSRSTPRLLRQANDRRSKSPHQLHRRHDALTSRRSAGTPGLHNLPWCARRDSNPHDVTHCHLKAARLPIPPRALGRSARNLRRTGSRPDQRRRCNKSGMEGQGPPASRFSRISDRYSPSGCRAAAAAFA